MTPLLLALPWVCVLLFVLLVARKPSELPVAGEPPRGTLPSVSVVVPARNEAHNIEDCLTSLANSNYPSFEIVVLDDRSDDGTAELASSVPQGNARRIRVLEGQPLPDGWLGKPWACHQAAALADGQLILFTDADTTPGPDLLGRAVAGLYGEGADLLTVVGRQRMESFWERLVQPQIFLVMLFRFPDFERTARNPRWREAIANGQFILFPRASYDAIGGHAAVRDEVVEDLALAQRVKRSGRALRIRGAERDLATRMYRSLGELVDGWSKNLLMGGLQSVPRPFRALVSPVALMTGVGLWLVPPLALAAGLAGVTGLAVKYWSATVYLTSALTWAVFTRQMGAPAAYGLLYPLGASVGTYVFVRSWAGGRRIEWKGRKYVVPPASERP